MMVHSQYRDIACLLVTISMLNQFDNVEPPHSHCCECREDVRVVGL